MYDTKIVTHKIVTHDTFYSHRNFQFDNLVWLKGLDFALGLLSLFSLWSGSKPKYITN